jgi:WhiB family redox-sensing transcriptional regulator
MADDSRLPGAVHHRWEWQELAACRGLRLKMFFHSYHERGPSRLRREAEAKAVCHRCPVIEVCRQHALRVPEPYGIWGGLSAEERATLLRSRRPTVPTR